MNRSKKEVLDKLWIDTKIFKYYQLCSLGKFNEADSVRYYAYAPENVKGWKTREMVGSEIFIKKERNLASKMKKLISSKNEGEEYLMMFGEDFYNETINFFDDRVKPLMGKHKKEQIDKIWQNSVVGDIIICYFKKDEKHIAEIYKKIHDSWFFRGGVNACVLNECENILNVISNWDDWMDYLDAVNYENPAMWDAFYATSIFDGIEKELMFKMG